MPDITMCLNHKCEIAKKCYRYMAKASEHQSFNIFNPIRPGECKYYMERYDNEKI